MYQSYHCHLGDFQTHWVQACMRSPRLTWSICIWMGKENVNKKKEPKELVVDRGGGEGKSKYHWATPRDGRDSWDGWDSWDSDGTIEQPLKMVEMLLGWNGMSIGCYRRWSWPADHWWRCAKGRWSHRSRCARHNCNHSIHTVYQNHWALWKHLRRKCSACTHSRSPTPAPPLGRYLASRSCPAVPPSASQCSESCCSAMPRAREAIFKQGSNTCNRGWWFLR